jgi:hypothetical protein
MTMKEMRETIKRHIEFAKQTGLDGLVPYYESTKQTLEALWREGYTRNFDNDFLKAANGYQCNTGDYEDVHIAQTLDLHSITATKKGVKALADFILN